MKKKLGDNCPYCLEKLSESFFIRKKKEHSENIKSALSMAKKLGEPVGRPRGVDYAEISKLRKQGLSVKKIAEKLSTSTRTVSRGSVENCLRKTKNLTEEK